MKATDFDLSKELKLDPSSGWATFRDSRLVVFSADAIGLLRQMIIDKLGEDDARHLLLRFGYQNGYSDCMQMRLNYEFDTEMDLLASGPVMHSWEGIVQAIPTNVNVDRDAEKFLFEGTWRNSYEAEQHLSFNHPASKPVCWSLAGYAAGWGTAFWGSPIIAIESSCVGQGNDHCEWSIRPPDDFGSEAAPFVAAYTDFWES